MLTDNLTESIKKMKQLNIAENAAMDVEKKAKNDADFSTLVDDFANSVKKLQKATTVMDYSITSKTLQYLEEGVEQLRNVVSADMVDVDSLYSARQHINKKVNPNLTKEWKHYYQKKTTVSISKLNTLGHLAVNPESISAIKRNIENGSEWNKLSLSDNGADTRLILLQKSIEEINGLEENLKLSDEIRNFVVSVTSQKAKVSDITDNIIQWIKEEKLDDKFVIIFKN